MHFVFVIVIIVVLMVFYASLSAVIKGCVKKGYIMVKATVGNIISLYFWLK